MKWQIFLDNLVKDNICTSKSVGIPFLKEKKNILCIILSALLCSIIAFFLKFENEVITYVILLLITLLISYGINKITKEKENTFYIASYAYIAALFATLNTNSFLDLILYILGYNIGFFIFYFLFDSLNHKFKKSQIPKYMEGLPIILVTLSIIVLLIGRYF